MAFLEMTISSRPKFALEELAFGIFFTLHSVTAKNTLLSQGTSPLWIPLKTNFKQ